MLEKPRGKRPLRTTSLGSTAAFAPHALVDCRESIQPSGSFPRSPASTSRRRRPRTVLHRGVIANDQVGLSQRLAPMPGSPMGTIARIADRGDSHRSPSSEKARAEPRNLGWLHRVGRSERNGVLRTHRIARPTPSPASEASIARSSKAGRPPDRGAYKRLEDFAAGSRRLRPFRSPPEVTQGSAARSRRHPVLPVQRSLPRTSGTGSKCRPPSAEGRPWELARRGQALARSAR